VRAHLLTEPATHAFIGVENGFLPKASLEGDSFERTRTHANATNIAIERVTDVHVDDRHAHVDLFPQSLVIRIDRLKRARRTAIVAPLTQDTALFAGRYVRGTTSFGRSFRTNKLDTPSRTILTAFVAANAAPKKLFFVYGARRTNIIGTPFGSDADVVVAPAQATSAKDRKPPDHAGAL